MLFSLDPLSFTYFSGHSYNISYQVKNLSSITALYYRILSYIYIYIYIYIYQKEIYIYIYIVCFSVCAVIGLFHGIGRAVFKSNIIKFINILVLSGTLIKISQTSLVFVSLCQCLLIRKCEKHQICKNQTVKLHAHSKL